MNTPARMSDAPSTSPPSAPDGTDAADTRMPSGNGQMPARARDTASAADPSARPDKEPPQEPVDEVRPPGTPKQSFKWDPLAVYKGAVRRFFTVYRHVIGLLLGGMVAYARSLPPELKRGFRTIGPRTAAWVAKFFVKRSIVALPFPEQLRRRLEILGPTFIKLGQVLAIRRDLLPKAVTDELSSLFDRLPPIAPEQVFAIVERDFGEPADDLFAFFDSEPLGAGSIAQAHRATTQEGADVVCKVIKPGIREAISYDLKLLEFVGVILQWLIPKYQPQQIIQEFITYTQKEVDYSFEADNAEIFDTNFSDMPGVVFPKIYRDLTSKNVLTMERIRGFAPGSPRTEELTEDERERVVDLGAASIIRMLYKDGFFHADLHAGNLMIIPGRPIRIGFIDFGMVGRFGQQTRHRLMYYFYALVQGDVEGASRYLMDLARLGKGADPQGFKRAVEDLSRRFIMQGQSSDFSIAELIIASLNLGGKYHVFFPVEMTLMVKALVTFEGVGRTLDPDINISAVSERHVASIFRERFDPRVLGREVLRNAPEMVDLIVRSPQLLTSGAKYLEEAMNNRDSRNPIAGLRSGILSGACIVGGALAVVQDGPVVLWVVLFVLGFVLAVFGRSD